MSEFEYLRYVTIGQYLPTGSVIHRLDPRARLLAGLGFVVAVTVAPHLAGLGLALAAALAALVTARVPLGYALRGLVPPMPFIAFLAILQILFGPQTGAAPLLVLGPVHISGASLLTGATLIARFATLVLGISLASFCISTTEMVHGLESLLRPLTRLGLPTHDFILMVQVTLRFLPLLALEAERIAKAQASRGAEWGTKRGGLLRRTRQVFPLLIPLFLTSLRRAENLAVAMEARGYDGAAGRTSMVVLRFRPADAAALALVAGITAAVVLM